MVQINFAQKQVNAKIVYYGPGMSGKTTNLEVVYQRAPQPNRGELTSISTDGDRTLFFDFMPLDLGTVSGMRTCFQIYTVPGQVYYNSTRKLVLQGVDGVVFVADSSAAMLEENLESMRNLEQNLNEYGKSLASMPLIIQYNKRDLPDAMTVEELNRHLNQHNAPFFEAIANTGQGVFPTLKALAARVLDCIHTGKSQAPQAAQAPAAPAPQPQGQAVPVSSGMTGFYVAPARVPGAPGAPAPAGNPATRPLQQTGFHARPAMPAGVAPAGPQRIAAQQAAPAPGLPPTVDPLTRTAMNAAHGPAPGQPAPAAAPTLRLADAKGHAPVATMAGGAPAQGASGLQMMRPDHGASAPPAPSAQRRAMPAARPAARSAARPEPAPAPAPKIQPRAAAARATPGRSKKSLVYTAVFVVAALGIGAVLARMFLTVV